MYQGTALLWKEGKEASGGYRYGTDTGVLCAAGDWSGDDGKQGRRRAGAARRYAEGMV